MGRMARSCTQSLLKTVNHALGMFGVAMILYTLRMLRVWLPTANPIMRKHLGSHTLYLALGFSCSGHVAAETASGCCLYIQMMRCGSFSYGTSAHEIELTYMVLVFLVCVFEAAVTADVFLNSQWEEDFPEDPTENLDKLKDFIKG